MGLLRRKSATTNTTTATREITPGVPGRCPSCDGFGYIEQIDLVNFWQSQHCRECGHRWEYQFDEDGHLVDMTDGDVVIDLTAFDAPAEEASHELTPGEWLRTDVRA